MRLHRLSVHRGGFWTAGNRESRTWETLCLFGPGCARRNFTRRRLRRPRRTGRRAFVGSDFVAAEFPGKVIGSRVRCARTLLQILVGLRPRINRMDAKRASPITILALLVALSVAVFAAGVTWTAWDMFGPKGRPMLQGWDDS